jgi:hypothetical protein
MPIAHGEGCYFADEATLDALERDGQVLFRYVDEAGSRAPEFGEPGSGANPNGSLRAIAGVINAAGNVAVDALATTIGNETTAQARFGQSNSADLNNKAGYTSAFKSVSGWAAKTIFKANMDKIGARSGVPTKPALSAAVAYAQHETHGDAQIASTGVVKAGQDVSIHGDAMENIEAADPTDPMERTDPTDPTESTDPFDPMLNTESSDHSDHFDLDR